MSRISFRVNSIDLLDSTLHKLNPNNLIRLNLTQKPSNAAEEYLLRNVKALQCINHDFVIDDTLNKVEKLSMTVRSVVEKKTLAGFFGFDDDHSHSSRSNSHTVDKFVGYRENKINNVNCKYTEPRHSLIGYCQINIKEIEKGINNTLKLDLVTKTKEKVGCVNLDVYIWNSPTQSFGQQINNGEILFVDPGCPVANAQPSVY